MTSKIKQPELGRVLVIGGCGFLGHHVVDQALKRWDCSISVIDLKCVRNRRPESDGVQYIETDITDPDALLKAFGQAKPDVVIHTASPPAQGVGTVSNALFEKVNVQGTRAVISACQQSAVKALVYTSSASVLSDNRNNLINATEDYPVPRGKNQPEYYSETKAAAEALVIAANRSGPSSNLMTCAIRPSGIFGEGDMQLIHHAINVYREGKDKFQVGLNDNLFDFTYVGNVAHAHLLAARAILVTCAAKTAPLDTEKIDGEVFHITNGSPVYFWDMMRAIWREAGSEKGTQHVWTISSDMGWAMGLLVEAGCMLLRKDPSFNRQRARFSCMTRYYDITKARRRLGYTPLVSLNDGVKRTVKWTLEQEKK